MSYKNKKVKNKAVKMTTSSIWENSLSKRLKEMQNSMLSSLAVSSSDKKSVMEILPMYLKENGEAEK